MFDALVKRRLPVDENILDEVKKEENFLRFVKGEFDAVLSCAGFVDVKYSSSKMHDAFQSWERDVKHLKHSMPSGAKGAPTPDHFKQAGVLAYWLRRFCPVISFEHKEKDELNRPHEEEKLRVFLRDYYETFLAFGLGFQICRFFEENKAEGGSRDPSIDEEYAQLICYFLKYKNVSPHAITAIYASLFR